MKPKALMLLAVAIGCGLVAMLGVQQAMQGSQQEVVVETRKVLVALKDLRPGERLDDTNVIVRDVPLALFESLRGDAVQKTEEYEERAIMIPVVAGDAVRKSKLSEKGQYSASSQIPKGMRIFTFSANDTQTHSGMLRAGDKVDVTVTFQAGSGATETKVLLECVEVFATENKTVASEDSKSEQRARSVSLLVSPEQDSFVKVAQARGQLALSLRNPDDDEVNNLNGINSKVMEDLRRSIGNDDVPGYDRRRFNDEDGSHVAADSAPADPAAPPAPAEPAAAQPAPAAASGSSNVQGFLHQGQTASVDSPPKNRWSMKVYNGNEAFKVEMDDPQAQKAASLSGGGVPGLLKSMWSSGQK